MKTITCIVNESQKSLQVPSGRTVLDVLRKDLGLYGTKEGCREGECGACTVIIGRLPHVPYRPVPSCMLAAGQLGGAHLLTIEGLDIGRPNRLQQAFIDQGASQCGFCTPGFIMALTGYLLSGRSITVEDAVDALDGNICRCTGYASIRRAVADTVEPIVGTVPSVERLIELDLLPPWFADMADRLAAIPAAGLTDEQLASSLADHHAASHAKRLVLAGGTDLFVREGDRIGELDPKFLVPESRPIEIISTASGSEELYIPAEATLEQIRLDENLNRMFPGLKESLLPVASHILRNRATVAGNLVNASPIADSAVLLLSWNADIILRSDGSTTRRLPLRDFYLGYKQLAMEPSEEVEALVIAEPESVRTWNFSKVSKRERLDIASCNSSAVFETSAADGGSSPGDAVASFTSVGLAVGGVAPVPYTAKNTMAWLEGKAVSLETFLASFDVLADEIAPIDDVRGSAAYKKSLAAAQLVGHYLACFPELCSYSDFANIINTNITNNGGAL